MASRVEGGAGAPGAPHGGGQHEGARHGGAQHSGVDQGVNRDKGELAFAAFLFALGVFILADTGNIRVPATANAVGPRFFPYAIGAFLVLVAVVLLLQIWRGHVATPEGGEDVDASRDTDWLTVATLLAVFLGHIALIETAGFVVATAVLFFGAAWTLGARRPVRDVAIAVILAVLVYLGFDRLLGVSLPGGFLKGVL